MDDVAEPLFHVAVPEEWSQALVVGRYDRSTRGRSLADVGFVHCSYSHQVAATANRYYADLAALVLLRIDASLLDVPVVVEAAAPGAEDFPHVYGPIPAGSVVASLAWERDADGVYRDPPV